ncbi:hypothetical protein HDU77_003961 [Chytriomyces hyalinus]|nr:hypothetical protein HDU77_003961 [Chytriomyces hyalinus]
MHAPLKLHPFVDYTHLLAKLDRQEVDVLQRRFHNASQASSLQPAPPSMDEEGGVALAERVLQSTPPPELMFGRVFDDHALDLSTVSLASKYLFQLATQDFLWKQLCEIRWSDKIHQSLSLHPLVDNTGLVAHLNRSELMEILHRRFLATDDSMSDQELATRVINTTLTGLRDVTVYAPLASYIAAEMDQNRERITLKELQAYEWACIEIGITFNRAEQWAYDDEDDEGYIRASGLDI